MFAGVVGAPIPEAVAARFQRADLSNFVAGTLETCRHKLLVQTLTALLAGFLLASFVYAKFTFEPRTHKDMEAVLTVEAGKKTPEHSLGEATLTVTVTGPLTLDVEEPRLGNAGRPGRKNDCPARTRFKISVPSGAKSFA